MGIFTGIILIVAGTLCLLLTWFLVWLSDKDRLDNLGLCLIMFLMFIGVLGITLILAGFLGHDVHTEEIEETYMIYSVDAPNGRYWIDSDAHGEGSWGLLGGYVTYDMKSDLTETYTLKYLDNGELKTLMFESTDLNFHVMFGDTFEYIYVKTIRRADGWFGIGDRLYIADEDHYIYIPYTEVEHDTNN